MNFRLILTILSSLFLINSNASAQERKFLTMPFDGGTLTFQYYEKDGVKVPDGPMEFKKANYTEKGECKDGYREGRWTAIIENKTNTETTDYTYRKGMLEGPTSIKFTTSDKDLLKYHNPDATFNFHNGRLYGENKVVHSQDTIYCNFGEDGKRIGNWRFVTPKRTVVIEYNENSQPQNMYEFDILGQKKVIEVDNTEMLMLMDFIFFDKTFREVFFNFRDKKRPELPTLCENKYGYLDAWVNFNKDN